MKHRSLMFSPTTCLVAASCLTALLAAGCLAETDDGEIAAPSDEDLVADSQYMSSLYHASGQSMLRVDMTDEAQYRFVVNRLAAAGKSRRTSPHLFERIETMRRGELRAAPPTGLGEAQSALTGKPCGHVLPMTETPVGAGSRVVGVSQVNCEGGADYLYTDIISYHTLPDGSDHRNVATVSGELFGGGQHWDAVTTEVNIPENRVFYMDSITYAADADGTESITYAENDSQVSNAPPRVNSVHPRDEYNAPGTTTDDPDRIRVCIQRGGTDCDYAAVNASGQAWTQPLVGIGSSGGAPKTPWVAAKTWTPQSETFDPSHVYIPLAGTFDAGTSATGEVCRIKGYGNNDENQSGIKDAAAQIALIDANSGHRWNGRTCAIKGGYAANDGGDLMKYLKHRLAFPRQGDLRNQVQFDLLADFGPDCYGYEHRVKLDYKVRVSTENCGVKTATMSVQPIDFKNSCVAEGTRVLLSDGRDIAIEQAQVGDRLVAEQGGVALTVTALTQGHEREPMIRLIDDRGHGLLITAKHPVVTASRGIVAAGELKEGEKVLTEQGEATLTSVAREEHRGRVYNLTLGTPEELAVVGPTGRTMFANGFLIGDNAMQAERSIEAEALMSVDPLSRIAPAWRRDYENAEAGKRADAR